MFGDTEVICFELTESKPLETRFNGETTKYPHIMWCEKPTTNDTIILCLKSQNVVLKL